jgi:hypothetical protein
MSVAPAIVYPKAIVAPGTTFLQTTKMWLVHHIGLDKDALHIYFALFLLFGSVLLFRWSLRSWKPYALILAIAVIGEVWDIRDGLLTSVPLVVSLPDSIHDIWNTMFWPIAILLLVRSTDVLGVRPGRAPAEDAEAIEPVAE